MVTKRLQSINPGISGRVAVTVFAWTVVTLGLLYLHLRFFPYAEDDAYIHFRIANHLADYGLPYFNLNDPVMSSSSPGWSVLLALLFRFISRDLYLVSILNALTTAGGAVVFTRFLQKSSACPLHPIHFVTIPLLYISLLITQSIGLMETSFALFLLSVGFLLLLNKRPFALFVLGVAAFTRFELTVFVFIALVYLVIAFRSRLLAGLGWLAVGVLPFVAYSLYFGGSLIPNSMSAKQVLYSFSSWFVVQSIVVTLLPNFRLGFWQFHTDLLTKVLHLATLTIVLAATIWHTLAGQKSADTRKFLCYGLVLGGAAIMAAYVWRTVFLFDWYVPLYTVPVVMGLYGVIVTSQKSGFYWVWLILLLLWFASIPGDLNRVILAAAIDNSAYYPTFLEGARVRKYLALGQRLYEQYPDAVVLTSEIGGLGYSFQGRIADGAGLVTPRALRFHPMKIPEERSSGLFGAIPVGFVQEVNPEIIISYEIFSEAFVKSKLVERYEEIQEPAFLQDDLGRILPGQLSNFGELFVFVRKDVYARNPWQQTSTLPK